jgi:hypothetical protein
MQRPIQPPPLEINNTTSLVLEIMIEAYPDRYLLRPGDRMVIEADPKGVPFAINLYEGGLQIYPGNTAEAVVTINGVKVEPDWEIKV